MQSLIDHEYALALNEQAILAGVPVKVHIKIDTGMHRLGIPAEAFSEVRDVFAMKGINVCGIYTHLCCADSRKTEDIAYTEEQISLFYRLLDALKEEGISLPKQHIQSSYGLLNYPDLKCDYVRAGIALYGVLSSAYDDTVLKPDLFPEKPGSAHSFPEKGQQRRLRKMLCRNAGQPHRGPACRVWRRLSGRFILREGKGADPPASCSRYRAYLHGPADRGYYGCGGYHAGGCGDADRRGRLPGTVGAQCCRKRRPHQQ